MFQLFVPPALSVANDHDFEKIMGHLCLGPELTNETPYFDYTVYRYVYDADYCIDWPMRTTRAEATFRAGLWLDHLFYSKTDFDIRFMGIVYGLIFFAKDFRTSAAICAALRAAEALNLQRRPSGS